MVQKSIASLTRRSLPAVGALVSLTVEVKS